MLIKLEVEVEVEFREGKFASRDDLEQYVQNEIDDADPGEFDTDEATYEVTRWEAQSVEVKKPPRVRRKTRAQSDTWQPGDPFGAQV